MFTKIIFTTTNLLKYIHFNLLDTNVKNDEINKLRNISFLEPYNIGIYDNIKNTYQTFYYIYSNLYEYCKMTKDEIILNNQIIQEIFDLEDCDMNEVRIKTKVVLDNKPDLYYGVMRWIAGNCWCNSLITNNYNSDLIDLDYDIINSINKSIELVEPINKPLVLFHGFELFSNYKEHNLKINNTFYFPGILSKTSKFSIAKKFAITQNFLQPKYFIIFYPANSKHIGLDIKLKHNDEFEYIGKQNEQFKIINICKTFDGIRLNFFYICQSLDY